jgi:hypothetical protein
VLLLATEGDSVDVAVIVDGSFAAGRGDEEPELAGFSPMVPKFQRELDVFAGSLEASILRGIRRE